MLQSKMGSSETVATLEAQIKALTSRSEMMRMKLERTQGELKATQRALAAEVLCVTSASLLLRFNVFGFAKGLKPYCLGFFPCSRLHQVGPDASLEDIVESTTQANAARRAAGRDVASGPYVPT